MLARTSSSRGRPRGTTTAFLPDLHVPAAAPRQWHTHAKNRQSEANPGFPGVLCQGQPLNLAATARSPPAHRGAVPQGKMHRKNRMRVPHTQYQPCSTPIATAFLRTEPAAHGCADTAAEVLQSDTTGQPLPAARDTHTNQLHHALAHGSCRAPAYKLRYCMRVTQGTECHQCNSP